MSTGLPSVSIVNPLPRTPSVTPLDSTRKTGPNELTSVLLAPSSETICSGFVIVIPPLGSSPGPLTPESPSRLSLYSPGPTTILSPAAAFATAWPIDRQGLVPPHPGPSVPVLDTCSVAGRALVGIPTTSTRPRPNHL